LVAIRQRREGNAAFRRWQEDDEILWRQVAQSQQKFDGKMGAVGFFSAAGW
jgi:hypothetical protein